MYGVDSGEPSSSEFSYRGFTYRAGLIGSQLYLKGESYLLDYAGFTSILNIDSETGELVEIGGYSFEDQFNGSITFETLVPVEAIPEPFTILGTGTAIGFSFPRNSSHTELFYKKHN